MKGLVSQLLLLCFFALATGTVEYMHNLQHLRQDAVEAAADPKSVVPRTPAPAHHDESNCEFHRQLHLPVIAAGIVPLLVLLGLFVAFLTLLSPPLVSYRAPSRLVCRGPPAC